MLRLSSIERPLRDYFSKESAKKLPTNTIIHSHGVTSDYNSPELTLGTGIIAHRGGSAFYNINGRKFDLNGVDFIVTNNKSEGTITIDRQAQLDSYYLFFSDEIVKSAIHYYQSDINSTLDDPYFTGAGELNFSERAYSTNEVNVHAYLQELLRISKTACTESNEVLHKLLIQLLRINKADRHHMARLNVVKKSTREELYYRLVTGRNYLVENFDTNVPLAEVASFAHLNSFHFLKFFHQAFNVTPHQFLMQIRIEKACQLLATGKSVSEVCALVGFSSLGSFSNLFKKITGTSPKYFSRA